MLCIPQLAIVLHYIGRLLNHIHEAGKTIANPSPNLATLEEAKIYALLSGYIERANTILPLQSIIMLWRITQDHLLKKLLLKDWNDDGILQL